MLIRELIGARCGQPFEHLGLVENPAATGLMLRTWLPGATAVTVKSLKDGSVLANMTVADPAGLFEAEFPERIV